MGTMMKVGSLPLANINQVALQAVGEMHFRVTAPEGVRIMQRPPLLPYEASRRTAKKFFG